MKIFADSMARRGALKMLAGAIGLGPNAAQAGVEGLVAIASGRGLALGNPPVEQPIPTNITATVAPGPPRLHHPRQYFDDKVGTYLQFDLRALRSMQPWAKRLVQERRTKLWEAENRSLQERLQGVITGEPNNNQDAARRRL